ncbi:MAG TPA: hypothetical protein VG365_03995, partial [Solirubrobacteraceae bacterium]|nr:hypothetical protein [Solirubrobacteraceae bacterium]
MPGTVVAQLPVAHGCWHGVRLRLRFSLMMVAVGVGVGVAAALAEAPAPAAASTPPVISVQGPQLLRNSVPWVPRGVQIVGLVAPDGALSGKYVPAHAHFGAAELQAALADHTDVVRFQV